MTKCMLTDLAILGKGFLHLLLCVVDVIDALHVQLLVLDHYPKMTSYVQLIYTGKNYSCD